MGGARPLLPQELPFQLLAFANWARAFRDGDRVNRTRRHRPRNLAAWARPRARGWPSRLAPRHARAKPVARSPGPAGAPSRCSGSVRPRHPPWDRTRRSDIRSRIQNPCGRCLGVEASGASSECTELQGRWEFAQQQGGLARACDRNPTHPTPRRRGDARQRLARETKATSLRCGVMFCRRLFTSFN